MTSIHLSWINTLTRLLNSYKLNCISYVIDVYITPKWLSLFVSHPNYIATNISDMEPPNITPSSSKGVPEEITYQDLSLLPLPIPETCLDLVFTFLEGLSLHNCKQVSKVWYYYIKTRIWRYSCNVKELKKSLEQNVRKGKLLHMPALYIDVPINGFVSNTTSNKILVRSFAATPLSLSQVCLLDVSGKPSKKE